MDVSIIMINYNTFELTKAAIESIYQMTLEVSFELILVDNLSPDGSGERLKEYFQHRIVYLQAGANLGTSKAFNLGLKKAQGKYILWLNTDILLKGNFIKKLFDFMEKTPQCGICGGNLLDFNGNPAHSFERETISLKSIRKQMSLWNFLFGKLFRKRLSRNYNYTKKPMKVGLVIGADMFIRRDVIDRIGGFDEDIFMYCEESEFAYRMQKETDYQVFSVPDAQMYHLEGASFQGKSFSERRQRAMLSGYCVYFQKHFGEESKRKYLQLLKRSYSKFIFFFTIFFLRKKREEYLLKRKIVREMIAEGKK